MSFPTSLRVCFLSAASFAALSAAPPARAQLNMTLSAQLDSYLEYNEVWGYTDGVTELAILGTRSGTSFINATNPAAPVEVAFIPGPTSIWRDIKTFGSYAYIVNESGEGFQVVDLSNPLVPSLVNADSTLFQTAHNIFVDEGDSLIYFCGTNNPGMVIYDLSADPVNPSWVDTYTDVYIHDLYVESSLAYLSDIYSGKLRLVDFSALPGWTTLDLETTVGGFTHNTWLTSGGDYCLTTDEIVGGHVQVWDVSDPNAIFPVAEYVHQDDPGSIVHNALAAGDYGYISWYTTGVQILDMSDPRFPQRVGHYDTSPFAGGTFNGAWGVYPFQPSGNIYVSDIEGGLFILDFTPDFGWIEGVVDDAGNAAPLEGVEVSIVSENNTVHTVSDGFFRFSLTNGAYLLHYSKFAYAPDSAAVSVANGIVSPGDMSLVRLPEGSLGGQVNALGSFDPLQAQVLVDGTPLAVVSDAGGNYLIPQIPEGSWTLTVELFGYAPATQVVNIVEGEHTTVNVSLIPALEAWDLESAPGWSIGVAGDTANRGFWQLADPEATGGGLVQPEDDHSPDGTLCFVTQAQAGGSIGSFDVDNGKTTVMSPLLDLTGLVDPVLSYYRWYTNNAGASPNSDVWLVQASDDAGQNWVDLENTMQSDASWTKHEFSLNSYISLTSDVQFRWVAEDAGGGSIVEALVDDIALYAQSVVAVGDDPSAVRLLPAARNPFQTATALRFSLDRKLPVRVEVFDLSGRRVALLADEPMSEGVHALPWTGRNDRGRELAAGVYFARLRLGEAVFRQKLVKMR